MQYTCILLFIMNTIMDVILPRPRIVRKIWPFFVVSDVNIMQYTCTLLFIRDTIMGAYFAQT